MPRVIHSLHHVNIRARPDEVARLKEFYCEIVGLIDGWRPPFASRGHWLYAQAQPVLHLVEASGEATPTQPGNVDHVAFRCEGLESTLARLRDLGVQHAVSQVPVVGDTQVLIRDPLGNGVELTFPARR